jgi:CRP/FNR family cyclic AMP-dependent transcriptional regulator
MSAPLGVAFRGRRAACVEGLHGSPVLSCLMPRASCHEPHAAQKPNSSAAPARGFVRIGPVQTALFRRFVLFAELDDKELASIAAVAKTRRYNKDDVIFHADESGDVFCLIKEGKVKVTNTSPEGKEIILSMLGPGDFFGEMALLDNEPRSATVVATESLELVTIWRADFLQILSENFSITRKVLAELSRRLRNASSRIESLATMDVYGRLARFFLDLAARQGTALANGYVAVQRPTHQSIANMIGTSRETVSRLIHDLIRQNLLLSEGKTIYLRTTALDQFRSDQ